MTVNFLSTVKTEPVHDLRVFVRLFWDVAGQMCLSLRATNKLQAYHFVCNQDFFLVRQAPVKMDVLPPSSCALFCELSL